MASTAQINYAFQTVEPTARHSLRDRVRFPVHRVVVGWYRSEWMQNLKDRFDALTSLPRGWDGYNGSPVSFTCASFAANLLERIYNAGAPEPSLVPGGDGTLQIEWHKNQFDIEIDVLGAYNVVASRYDHRSGEEEVVELASDFTILAQWVEELTTERTELAAASA